MGLLQLDISLVLIVSGNCKRYELLDVGILLIQRHIVLEIVARVRSHLGRWILILIHSIRISGMVIVVVAVVVAVVIILVSRAALVVHSRVALILILVRGNVVEQLAHYGVQVVVLHKRGGLLWGWRWRLWHKARKRCCFMEWFVSIQDRSAILASVLTLASVSGRRSHCRFAVCGFVFGLALGGRDPFHAWHWGWLHVGAVLLLILGLNGRSV